MKLVSLLVLALMAAPQVNPQEKAKVPERTESHNEQSGWKACEPVEVSG